MPPGLMAALPDSRWSRDLVGESGASVFRLRPRSGGAELFLKHGNGGIADDISHEMLKLGWLAPFIEVPAVTHFERSGDHAWLLMTALPGRTAWQLLHENTEERGAVVDALAAFLRRLHAIPVSACPFISDLAFRLACARTRLDAGLVDEDDFDEARHGWSAQQVWDAMQAQLPLAADAVVTHGDYSLDNIFLARGEVTGCIDVGRAGIADRYQDLAIVWQCLGEFDASLQARFLARYGIAQLDVAKLRFYLMLDEMF